MDNIVMGMCLIATRNCRQGHWRFAPTAVTFFLYTTMVLTATGCDALYRLLQKEGAEEKELVGEVVPFEPNPTVQEVQELLKAYGYNPGVIDGVLGLKTRNAIERFQVDCQLEPTRFVDQQTWERLREFKDNGLVMDGEINVLKVQEALKAAGLDPGKIDGILGQKTMLAVKEFQKKHDLKIDGKIGFQTLKALAQYVRAPEDTEKALEK